MAPGLEVAMRSVSLLVALVCVLGCKGEEESFELNARRIAELAAATCSCSDSVPNTTCAIAYGASLQANLLPQVQAGRVRLDSARWIDCIAELTDCKAPDACEKLFTGTVLENGACVSSQECAAGLRCVAEDAADEQCPSAGTCEEIETFERGERCDREGKCEGDDICGVGTPRGDAGDEPSGAFPDDDAGSDEAEDAGVDAGAEPVPAAGDLVCRKPIEKGDPCPVQQLGEEGTRLCEEGTGCVPDGDDIVCGDPVAAGEACTYGFGTDSIGVSRCAKGHRCDAASGVCVAFDFPKGGDIGEDCDEMQPCLPGFVCIDDECASPLPNGSECESDDQCAAECFDERCAPTYVACGIQ
jgi:hypothetical protein